MNTVLRNVRIEELESLKNEILLNKYLTNNSPSNMYEILFDCENFDKIFTIFLEYLKQQTNKSFDLYIKNMWGYIQTNSENGPIFFNESFKDQLVIKPEYSFVYMVESSKTNLYLKNEKFNLNYGDMVIFRTEDFVKDEFDQENRICLIASISTVSNNVETIKKVMI